MPSQTSLLINEGLWSNARRLLRKGKSVRAAIAYFGQRGATLLPFRKGAQLVVDLSIPSVRAGQSDPREIEKLLRRGVEVFSRAHLHAKVVASDTETLVGSANASGRAAHLLDEAAILTSDPASVRRTREFVASLCNEPVRREYLALCKREYRPPRFAAAGGRRARRAGQRISPAKLWIVRLAEGEIPEGEHARLAQGEKRARAMIRRHDNSETSYFWWSRQPAFASALRPGDWIICATRDNGGSTLVSPPGQFLFLDSYARGRAQRRYVFHIEVPLQDDTVPWSQFRRAVQKHGSLRLTRSPRTRAIRSIHAADAILRLWTASGRRSRRLRRN